MAKISKNIKHWVSIGKSRITFMRALRELGLPAGRYFSCIQRIGPGKKFPTAQAAYEWIVRKEQEKLLPKLSANDRLLARYAQERAVVISHYTGGTNLCPQCGEGRARALCIDHVNGDGASERKKVPSQQLYRKIISAGFPARYQVLCHNCNICKYHETDKRKK